MITKKFRSKRKFNLKKHLKNQEICRNKKKRNLLKDSYLMAHEIGEDAWIKHQ